MDSKRMKFSPQSIDEIEKQTIARLMNNDNRYEVPPAFQGRVQTNWDALVLACPAPITYTKPSLATRARLVSARYDCFLPPSFACNCYKCLTTLQPEVENYHAVMEKQELEGSIEKVNVVPRSEYQADMDRGIYPVLDCIINVAHFYSDYIYVPGVATFDQCPETPSFSRVMFVTAESPDYRRRKQWALRMTIIPTRLVF